MTQLLHVAATLGLADLLRVGPKSSHELAAAVRADPEALYRVLRALSGLGIFAETMPGTFGLTPLAEPLRSDVPGSLPEQVVWTWPSRVARGKLSLIVGEPARGRAMSPSI